MRNKQVVTNERATSRYIIFDINFHPPRNGLTSVNTASIYSEYPDTSAGARPAAAFLSEITKLPIRDWPNWNFARSGA
jgi:hypothetical protein